MARDFLDAGNFSPKERAILTRATQMLVTKVRAGSVALNSPTLVRKRLALQFSGLEQEVFGVIYLDTQNRLIDFETLFTSTLTQTSVYSQEVVKAASRVTLRRSFSCTTIRPDARSRTRPTRS